MSKKNHGAAENDLIYDWNLVGSGKSNTPIVELDDETLRDGLQSPSVRHPSIDQKKHLLHLMAGQTSPLHPVPPNILRG